MSTLDIVDKNEGQNEEESEAESCISKITLDKIKKEMDRPNVFFSLAIFELLMLVAVVGLIVYIVF